MKVSSSLLGGVLVLLTLCETSCSTQESAAPAGGSNSGKYYIVSARAAEFYRYGPQQASGPDQKLAQGTLMTLIRAAFGYSKVQLTNGMQGYVATQDIHTAPPAVVQAAINPNPPITGETSEQLRFRLNPMDPRFQPPPPALPEDQPEPTPIPGAESSPTP